MYKYLKFFEELSIDDIPTVGGKNASLGEMYHHLRPQGVNLPNGVATTADAYRYFLSEAGINQQIIDQLTGLDVNNVHDLAARGAAIREIITNSRLPEDFEEEIKRGYRELCQKCGHNGDMVVAIRSSATAEDLPNASFAGQQATFLNIKGEHDVLRSVKECIASLFTDRAIVYRITNGFDHMKVLCQSAFSKWST